MTTLVLWKNKVIGKATGHVPTIEQVEKLLSCPHQQHLSLKLDETSSSSLPVRNPQHEFTDTDGGVFGVRFFEVFPGQQRCFLVSPSSRFVWETSKAVAVDFINSSAVRGHNGFHAAWPVSLAKWTESFVDHIWCPVKALVKGTGDPIIGDVGWRSERCEVLSVQAGNAEQIGNTYGISWIVGRPTNEQPVPTVEWLIDDPVTFVNPRLYRQSLKTKYV